jgi:uncharacterized membrane protein YphA (DoxX/SURF4 family)
MSGSSVFKSVNAADFIDVDNETDLDSFSFSSSLNPFQLALCLIPTTYMMAIMWVDVFDHGHIVIFIGYLMRWVSLMLAFMLTLHLFAVKYPTNMFSLQLLKNNFYFSPKLVLSWLVIIAVIGGCMSFTAKSVITCGDYDYEDPDPCCCNEHKG